MEATGEIKLHFEGVLEKAGKRFFEGFRKRWFVLDGKDLTYYKAPEYTDENYLGKIDLSEVKSVNPSKAINNGFQIITRARTYTFSAPTPELSTDWLSVLRQAMQLKSFQSRKNSRADSFESEYDKAETRSQRSVSEVSEQSDVSTNETDEFLYESIVPTKKPPSYSTDGDYELIPVAVSSKNKSPPVDVNDGTYDLIGGQLSCSSSKAASSLAAPSGTTASPDSAYGLVGPPSSSVGAPSGTTTSPDSTYGLVGPPSSPVVGAPSGTTASSDSTYGLVGPPSSPVGAPSGPAPGVSGPPSEPEYGLVGLPSSPIDAVSVVAREISGPQSDIGGRAGTGGVPPEKDKADAENGFEGSCQYAQVRKPKNKCTEERKTAEDDVTKSCSNGASLSHNGALKQQRMLSIISEDVDDNVHQDESEQDAPALPSPIGANTTYAITEMKRLLEQEARQHNSVEEDEDHIADKESVGSASAFELLKQLLQRLDSQVE